MLNLKIKKSLIVKLIDIDNLKNDIRNYKAYSYLQAILITDKKGNPIAKVIAHYGDSGMVTVNVWHLCKWDNPNYKEFQSGQAGGGGYDKFAAALSGLTIYGHLMTDHSGNNLRNNKKYKNGFKETFKKPGYSLSNWNNEKQVYLDCYKSVGLRYLEDLGFKVFYLL